jgi:hypothetical protein
MTKMEMLKAEFPAIHEQLMEIKEEHDMTDAEALEHLVEIIKVCREPVGP